jgi:hypothetical protein
LGKAPNAISPLDYLTMTDPTKRQICYPAGISGCHALVAINSEEMFE